jgi:hypothetical protein
MGDSHMKGYAPELRNRLGKDYEVMGMVTPGARIQNIMHLCSQETARKDTVILWGGSNGIVKNETASGLRHLRKFVN